MRITVKRGRRQEAADMLKAAGGKRVCLVASGNNDVVTVDFEFATMADYAASVDARYQPETQAGMSAWWDITVATEDEVLMVMD